MALGGDASGPLRAQEDVIKHEAEDDISSKADELGVSPTAVERAIYSLDRMVPSSEDRTWEQYAVDLLEVLAECDDAA